MTLFIFTRLIHTRRNQFVSDTNPIPKGLPVPVLCCHKNCHAASFSIDRVHTAVVRDDCPDELHMSSGH